MSDGTVTTMDAGKTGGRAAASDWAAQLHALKDARVMIVDDEPIMIDAVQAFLEEAGYSNFLTTEDSRVALDMMLRQRPDVVLLDLVMPVKSGIELLEEIRHEAALRFMPVIVLTAASDSDTKLRVLELGATDFLSKPVDSSELVLRLRNALAFKAYQDQLAYNDALTGLPNRQLFLERLAWTLNLAQRHGKQSALLQVGLDRFKQINDTLGHVIGDEVLKAAAKRLADALRAPDAVGGTSDGVNAVHLSRLGGDEFVVLVSEIGHADAASAIARRLLEVMKAPFEIAGRELFVGISVGISLFPQDGREGTALLTSVDLAMAQAKQSGRNTYAFFSAETNARSFERLSLETELRKAIEANELELYYQPKVETTSGRVVGAEALLRWNHERLGPVSPGRFIPLAEETGLILPLGEWVIHHACEEAVKWQRAGCNLPVSVNVSTLQFRRGDMPRFIESALRASGLQASNLIVELTESLLMENASANIDMLRAIKALGVRLSMDDFGTGYSSLSYLKQFPLDEIKIDQAFVRDLPLDPGNVAIVGAVISMARGLGLKVTAEGVETPEQLRFMEAHGCDQIQGFLFSKALPSQEFHALMRQALNCAMKTERDLKIAS